MSRLARIASVRLADDAGVARLTQTACFIAGPAVLVAGLRAVTRAAGTPGELVNGVLTSACAAMLLVVIGLLVAPAGGQGGVSR